jgi:uncharacterized protein YcfL
MKKILLICLCLTILVGCNNDQAPDPIQEAEQSLLATDKDFSAMVQSEGMAKAMAKYYDDAVVTIKSD